MLSEPEVIQHLFDRFKVDPVVTLLIGYVLWQLRSIRRRVKAQSLRTQRLERAAGLVPTKTGEFPAVNVDP